MPGKQGTSASWYQLTLQCIRIYNWLRYTPRRSEWYVDDDMPINLADIIRIFEDRQAPGWQSKASAHSILPAFQEMVTGVVALHFRYSNHPCYPLLKHGLMGWNISDKSASMQYVVQYCHCYLVRTTRAGELQGAYSVRRARRGINCPPLPGILLGRCWTVIHSRYR